MVSVARVIKNSLSVNNSVIDSCVLDIDETGTTILRVMLHPRKSHSNCRSVCSKRCPVYDRSTAYRK